MALLTFLFGWYTGWIAAGAGRVDVRFGASDEGLPKRSAWVEAESLHRSGQLTVWESGETELEVNDITSVDLVHAKSGRIETAEELTDLLVELLREVEREDR
jgi:hypothetical protein